MTLFLPLASFTKKRRKGPSFFVAGFSWPESPACLAGVSGPWIFLPSGQSVARYWIPLRSTTGGFPESPGDRSIRPWCPESPARPASSTSLRPGAEFPAGPEYPAHLSGVSGLSSSVQSVGSYGCLARRYPGRSPECPACPGVSGPLRPESPA